MTSKTEFKRLIWYFRTSTAELNQIGTKPEVTVSLQNFYAQFSRGYSSAEGTPCPHATPSGVWC